MARSYLRKSSTIAHDALAASALYPIDAQVGEDVLEAVTWTRDQAAVDPTRISVIGWSYGGGGVLAALRAMPPGPPMLARAVMYYPDCRGETPWSGAGISALMLMGAIDDVARPALCEAVVKGAPPGAVRSILYPDARHSFDVRGLPERAEYPFGTEKHGRSC